AEPARRLCLGGSARVQCSGPAGGVCVGSVAGGCQARGVAVLLAGANKDGANGVRARVRHGASCYVRQPGEALISTMPQAGLDVHSKVVPWNHQEIINFFRNNLKTETHEND